MTSSLVNAVCPVCSHSVASVFFDGGAQPLATLGWPECSESAQAMPRHPHNYVQCPKCSHVWNRSFTYDVIPYQNSSNRMFNKGGIWAGHLAMTRELVKRRLPNSPTVVDIGCGEGHFVRGIAASCGQAGRFIGFDPSAAPETGNGVEFYGSYFEPLRHMPQFRPDAVVIRHVLEHLTDPASLLEQLAWGAAKLDNPCWLFAEVPCIDRVHETGRLADFFYEHPSHFSTESFRVLMSRAGEIEELAHGYDGEVVYALLRLTVPDDMRSCAMTATTFFNKADRSRSVIRAQLDNLAVSGKRVAIWGGTGKAAAFIHQFGVDAERFPLVVDSDQEKVGSYVPGAGQKILFRDVLKLFPADIIIIPAQWRAKDIVAEMLREGIVTQQIMIEHLGMLVDFSAFEHPYR